MKEYIGLLFFFCISGVTLFFAIRRRIATGLTVVLLLFAIASGLGIAHHDAVRAVFSDPSSLKLKEDLAAIKQNAVQEIRSEAQAARESISFASAAAKNLTERVDARFKELDALRESARESEARCKASEDKTKELAGQAVQAQAEAEKIERLSADVGLILTRLAWLQTEAASASGDARVQAACQQILDGLDDLVAAIIPDPKARAEFIANVKSGMN
jgi:hypothetical protein